MRIVTDNPCARLGQDALDHRSQLQQLGLRGSSRPFDVRAGRAHMLTEAPGGTPTLVVFGRDLTENAAVVAGDGQ